ncbi:XRE family transcriptional regulator [Bacillaceae bacterium CLA-AA-H227]|uniref:XRE family transcriptional regulator n=1 Tax=Robertmurraya yapensis (ex Hitch et al 2024) TaxID=3133160 RepID=A0ACC6SCC3_9BACI
MSIKERIIKKRKELNLNQTELAKRAGLQPPAISQYESGNRNPSYDALVKLSHALNVTIDYLVSGIEQEENITEPTEKVLLKIFQNSTQQKKQEILEYAFLSAGYQNQLNFFSTDPKQYAKQVFNVTLNGEFPIDIYKLAKKLNLTIIIGNLEGQAEALLLKNNNTIILDHNQKHEARIKMTIATMIGHFLLPWHSQASYYYRKQGKSTLSTDNIDEIEASSFATNLITPPEILEKDLNEISSGNISLKTLKHLADEKYKVSLTSLCNRLVEFDKDRFAVVNSSEFEVTKVFSGSIVIKENYELNQNSKAYELLTTPSKMEELREGRVPANTWIIDSENDGFLFESSIYNPTYKSVLTLLTKL